MGGPNGQGYAGQPLAQNVQSAYTDALGASGAAASGGANILGDANALGDQAGALYGDMGSYRPSDVTSGQLSNTNLQPYMNPFTRDVIDTTMNDLNTQFGVQRQGIDDYAASQYAFGGDRQQLQSGVLGDKFLDTKARTLADLYSKNFLNAQEGAKFDIGSKLTADTNNAGIRSDLFKTGAGGLGNLAQLYGGIGSDLTKFGINNMGQLANLGFGFGDALQKNQLAAGALQTQQQQQLIDAIKMQYGGYTGAPMDSLSAYLGAIQSPGNAGTTKTDPGLYSYLGLGTSLLGSAGKLFNPISL